MNIVVGYFGTKSLFKKIDHPSFTHRNILTGEHVSLDPSGVMPPRIGPVQIRRIFPSIKTAEVENVSGYNIKQFYWELKSGDSKFVGQSLFETVGEIFDTEEEEKLWNLCWQEMFSDTGPDYHDDPCLFEGHDWVDTGMKISYCRSCECKGKFDPMVGSYRYIGE